MKTSVVLLALVGSVAAAPSRSQLVNLDANELALNDDLISLVNSQQSLWVAGRNEKFEGMTLAQAKGLMGARMDGQLPPAIRLSYRKESVPASFDARTAWPNCPSITLVRDQSACGSCWAFGSTEAFNDRYCVATGTQTIFSTTDVLGCCSVFTCGDGCDGGYPEGAWSYFVSKGVVTDSCFPYPSPPCAHHVVSPDYPACPSGDYASPKCNKTCADGSNFNNDKIKAKSSYSISSETDVMQEVSTKGPVTAAFTVYADFLTYKSGVYKHTSGDELGGHAIEIVGYGEDSGTKYWIVKNSWNPSWGDNGYFKIIRGVNECGIEGSVVAGDAA